MLPFLSWDTPDLGAELVEIGVSTVVVEGVGSDNSAGGTSGGRESCTADPEELGTTQGIRLMSLKFGPANH